MKIPKKIQIAGRMCEIKIDSVEAGKTQVNGSCHSDGDLILLDDPKRSSMSKGNQEQTLIHEVLHKINNLLGKGGTEYDNEDYVNPVSELLYQVFKQIESK